MISEVSWVKPLKNLTKNNNIAVHVKISLTVGFYIIEFLNSWTGFLMYINLKMSSKVLPYNHSEELSF